MNLYHLFLILQFSSGLIIISYKGFAINQGLPIGKLFGSENPILGFCGIGLMLASIIAALFSIKWYYIMLGILIGFVFSFLFTFIFKAKSQWLVFILLISAYFLFIIRLIF